MFYLSLKAYLILGIRVRVPLLPVPSPCPAVWGETPTAGVWDNLMWTA